MASHRTGPTTERLEHREFTLDDAEVFFAINSSPVVMRFTGEPLLGSLDAARKAIAGYPDFDDVGFGRWACVLRDTHTVIGFCGLKYLPDLDEVDVGYRFLPQYWSRGLATEACMASLAFGFNTLSLDQIIAMVLPENTASIRVLEKSGMQFDAEIVYDGISALRYLKRRSACL